MRQTTQTARQAAAQQIQGSWTRERKIYLAIGVLASLGGRAAHRLFALKFFRSNNLHYPDPFLPNGPPAVP
jgi:hypothetical protein